jgi:hypothetical protein
MPAAGQSNCALATGKTTLVTAPHFSAAINRVERITSRPELPPLWSAPFPVVARVVLVAFATAARYYGLSPLLGAQAPERYALWQPFSGCRRSCLEEPGRRNRSVLGFLFGIIDPADSPGLWCSA